MKRGNMWIAIALISFAVAGIQPGRAKAVDLSDAGWSDPSVGDWDPVSMTGTLTTDLTEGIEIVSNGITLDGKDPVSGENHSVTGPGTRTGIGVSLSGRTGVTVKNLNVTQWEYGVLIKGGSDNTLSRNTAGWNSAVGIYVCSSSTNNTLTGNFASNNGEWGSWGTGGIFVISSANNTLTGNTASGNGCYGIYLDNSSEGTLTGNTASNNYDGIHLRFSSSNTLTENTASDNANQGVWVSHSDDNTLTENTASDNDLCGIWISNSSGCDLTGNTANWNHYYGITIAVCGWNVLAGNTANSNGIGIEVTGCSNITLTANTAECNDWEGIFLNDSSSNAFSGNIANSNGQRGIMLSGSSSNTLTGNTANWNVLYSGVLLHFSSDGNTLTDNTFDSNGGAGIRLDSSSTSNTLTGNTASNNGYGIYLSSSTSNKVYNNNFIGNLTQAFVGEYCSGNVFSLEKPEGGNFWSDWTTPDFDHDGFVDLPYEFSGRADYFPWARENGWLLEGPFWPEESTLVASDIGLTWVVLTWTPAIDDVGVTEYKLFQGNVLVAVVLAEFLECAVTGLQPDAPCTFKVEACDVDGNETSDGPSTTVQTLTPEGAIAALAESVAALNLKHGIENSLDGKLHAALNALDDLNEHNNAAAIGSLGAFITHVQLQRGEGEGDISEEDADALIAAAQEIIAVLTGV